MSKFHRAFSLALAMTLLNVVVTPVLAVPAAEKTKLAQDATKAFDKLFLTPADLPHGFKMTQQDASSKDESPNFARFKGEMSGMKIFQGPADASLQRIVDIRYAFPNEQLAQQFLQAARTELSEKTPEVTTFKPVGSECKVFGGVSKLAVAMGLEPFNQWFYTFREGRVVVKLFGAPGPAATGDLRLEKMVPIAQSADKHCKGY